MPSGGRRPGAGAPKGNRNRLRHGLASRYVQETLLPALAPYPDLHRWFLNFQRKARRNKKAQRGSSASIIETLIYISEFPADHPRRRFALQALNHKLERALSF